MPLSVRLETLGGVATPLVLRGTPLPAKRSETFSTAADSQVSVEVSLLLGESPLARNNIPLGKMHLREIPPAPKGQRQIKVEFSVSTTCAVTARASLQGADLASEQVFEPGHELTDDFIKRVLAGAESNRAADDAELARIETVRRAKDLIAQAEERLNRGADTQLSELVANLGLALASGDSGEISEKSDALASNIALSGLGGFDLSGFFGTARATANPVAGRSAPATSRASTDQRLASQAQTQVLGKIFGGTSFTLDTQLCFVLMPFDRKFQPLYDDHIKPTVEAAELRCERADDIHGISVITWDIWERINRARFLIAELTDQNPNVFYELGLAHALSKDVILITQSMDFVPFDLKTIRCIVYEFTPRGTQDLQKALAKTIAAVIKAG
ncbi:MAG: Hsp70 family protein [Candidatus Sulfotelmatobacter sp.]